MMQEWVDALRSGEYNKMKGSLRVKIYGGGQCYCAVGVLCDISAPERWTSDSKFMGRSGTVEPAFLDEFEIPHEAAELAMTLNDSGYSFNQIADHLEERWISED